MTPKQWEYRNAGRTLGQKTIHVKAMASAFSAKKTNSASCADCRKSQCENTGKAWEFVCTLKKTLCPKTCPDFQDARKPTWEGAFVA